MSDQATKARPKTPPLLPDQREELVRKQEEEGETSGVEALRKALDEARSAVDDADAALDEIEAEG